MLPLLRFAAGLVVGIAGVTLLKSGKAKQGLDQAQTSLRDAAVYGLSAIEKSSASLREKLEPAVEAAVEPSSADAVEPTGPKAADSPGARRGRDKNTPPA